LLAVAVDVDVDVAVAVDVAVDVAVKGHWLLGLGLGSHRNHLPSSWSSSWSWCCGRKAAGLLGMKQ
jgi:hypothetical protein